MKATRTMNMLDPFGKGFLPGQVKAPEVSIGTIQRIKDNSPTTTSSLRISYRETSYSEPKHGYMGRF